MGYLRQLVEGVVGVVRRDPVEIVGLARPVAGEVVSVAGPVERVQTRLMQYAQQMRHRIVAVIRVHAVGPGQLRSPAKRIVAEAERSRP